MLNKIQFNSLVHYFATSLFCYFATLGVLLSRCFTTSLFCFFATLLLCFPTSLIRCFSVLLHIYFATLAVLLFCYFVASLLRYCFVTLLLWLSRCLLVLLFHCFATSLLWPSRCFIVLLLHSFGTSLFCYFTVSFLRYIATLVVSLINCFSCFIVLLHCCLVTALFCYLATSLHWYFTASNVIKISQCHVLRKIERVVVVESASARVTLIASSPELDTVDVPSDPEIPLEKCIQTLEAEMKQTFARCMGELIVKRANDHCEGRQIDYPSQL